jgi:hypothetical protein
MNGLFVDKADWNPSDALNSSTVERLTVNDGATPQLLLIPPLFDHH